MDGDVQADSSFAVSFPLPFRVLFLTGLGILGWATNLHGLERLGIDAAGALELRAPEGLRSRLPLPTLRTNPGFKLFTQQSAPYPPVYRLFAAYSIWCLLSWSLFRHATHGHPLLVDAFRYLAAICNLGVLIVLLCPFDVVQKRERDKFLLSIRRCFFPPPDRPTYFADIVLADVLTSFAKVFGDVWLSVRMLLPGSTLLVLPARDGWLRWLIPAIMSLPYLARLRQCLIDHMQPSNDNRRHLANAVKYATAFPVIFLSAAQGLVSSELMQEREEDAVKEVWNGEHLLFRLWLFAAAVNSLYSFWWDVTNDWGLDLLITKPSRQTKLPFSPPRRLILPSIHSNTSPTSNTFSPNPMSPNHHTQTKSYPYGLRSTLLYPLPVYPIIIFLNLVLRLTWSIKLSSHLHSHLDGGKVIFWLEVAELVRRWMWVFVRVEWEIVRKGLEGTRRVHEAEEFELEEDEGQH